MSYTPFDPSILPLFFFYIGISIFSIVMTTSMFLKWKQRKVKSPLLMAIVFLLFTLAVLVLAIGFADTIIENAFKEIYRFSLPLAYSTMVLADIFLFLFAAEIVGKGRQLLPLFIVFGAVILVMLWLPWNWWGVPEVDYAGQLNTRLYSTLALIVYSYIVYFYIASVCWKARGSSQNVVQRQGFQLLTYATWCMVGFFAMFVIDTLLIVFFSHPGYSAFVYMAWVFAVAFYILVYLSLVMPAWFKRRVEH